MTRKELAQQVFLLVQRETLKNAVKIWQAIAETDDNSLLQEYEKLINENYTKERPNEKHEVFV